MQHSQRSVWRGANKAALPKTAVHTQATGFHGMCCISLIQCQRSGFWGPDLSVCSWKTCKRAEFNDFVCRREGFIVWWWNIHSSDFCLFFFLFKNGVSIGFCSRSAFSSCFVEMCWVSATIQWLEHKVSHLQNEPGKVRKILIHT